jgi:protein gp37
MATRTAIEWTEVTWNPSTGCDRISSGCDNCYALTLAKRLKAMGAAKYQVDGDPRTSGPGFGVAIHPDALRQPYAWRSPRVVFVNSARLTVWISTESGGSLPGESPDRAAARAIWRGSHQSATAA